MMSVFNETIDAAIRKLLDQMAGFPVAVCSREFLDGYRAYFQNEAVDFYSLVLPKEAPQRCLEKIDDAMFRPQLGRIFAAMDDVIRAVRLGEIPIDKTLSKNLKHLSWPADFRDKDDSDVFHTAVKLIGEYEKFQYADSIEDSISIPPEFECHYDQDEGLIDVTSFKPQRESFVDKDSNLAVIPKYTSDSGIKERFAQLFQNGIPDKWRVWVSPARIVAEENVPQKICIQEERMWGVRFNEAAFKKIFSKSHGEFKYLNNELPDRLMRVPLYKLQYQIESNDKEGTSAAIIEELIDIAYGPSAIDPQEFVYGSSSRFYVRHRMVHIMYDWEKAKVIHMDLSHLYYNETDYIQRKGQSLGKIKPHATKKMKVYKIDGEIPFDVATDLIGISLDGGHNPEVLRLLNGD